MSTPEQPERRINRTKEPQSEESEKGLLGSVLLSSGKILDECIEKGITAAHFVHPAHGMIFESCLEMMQGKRPLDFISLTERLEATGKLEQVGGAAYVTELFTFVPSAANAWYYAQILLEMFARRKVLALARELREIAYESAADAEEVLTRCEEKMVALRNEVQTGTGEAVKHCKEAVYAALDQIEAVYKKRGGTVGMSSGFVDWDRSTGGFRKGDMIVIGGRPSQGKSALAMQIAEHVAIDCKKPVAFFSVEMNTADLMERTLLSRTRIDLQKMRDGFFSELHMTKLSETMVKIIDSPLYLDRCASLSVAQFRSRARRAWVRYKLELIVVDYLQLMRSTSKRATENRQIEIAEISRGIKEVANELNIPIVVCAQLSRDVEALSRRPKLSDLKESGSIEQDADQVMLIYQLTEKELKELKELEKKQMEDLEENGKKEECFDYNALLMLRKQRKGPKTDVKVRWQTQYTYFEPVTKKLYSNDPKDHQR